MRNEDIKEMKEYKIETINDFVQYHSYWFNFDYRWETDDGRDYLLVWVKFPALRSLTKVIGEEIIDEKCGEFMSYLKSDCICFPYFEDILECAGLSEEEIKEIF